jgi:hypothetical protein
MRNPWRRVVGVDINPQYIDEARQRYDGRVPALKLLAAATARNANRIHAGRLQKHPVSRR